ncbi:MAG: hypothetical protein ABSA83_22945 [Verrucomicrobiota bacterium]|jgi:hypothetical protein
MNTKINTASDTPNANDSVFVIEQLKYQATVGGKAGRFVDMVWDTEPMKNGAPRKELVLGVELEERDDSGQPFQVRQAFNFLPRGRGKTEFKKQMESFFGAPLTPAQLAGFSKASIVGKPVIVNYKTDHLGHVVFDKFTPVMPTQPPAA